MFSFVPACSDPIVTTAESVGATSRETIVCSRITVAAAITTGSMLDSGIEPCAPRPNMRICRLSAEEVTMPTRQSMFPDGKLRPDSLKVGDLTGYRTLILPGCDVLTEWQADLLEAFVEHGGRLVVAGTLGSNLGRRMDDLLGRVWNIALVFAWCTIPIGAFAGGLVVSATHRPDLVYAGVGAVIVAIALGFTRSGLAGGQVPTA